MFRAMKATVHFFNMQTFLQSKSCLLPGDSLKNGEKLTSDNGQFTLCMQSDGNLVLYSGDNPLWESRTQGKGHPPYRLVMQENSNLCIYYGSLPVEDYYGSTTTSDMVRHLLPLFMACWCIIYIKSIKSVIFREYITTTSLT